MRRILTWAVVVAALGAILMPAAVPVPAHAAATGAFSFNWSGGLSTPVVWDGNAPNGTWDVLTHAGGGGDPSLPYWAQHGAACTPPPATHLVTTLENSVFICRNHVMTSIADRGYGADVLTPDHMVDFASGESVVSFAVST